MGIESVSYRFEPSECQTSTLVEFLHSQGATRGENKDIFVFSGPEHWIDVFLSTDGPRVAVVQFRAAVTNPAKVVTLLDQLLAALQAGFGGRLTDASGRRPIPAAGRFDMINAEFNRGREMFTRNFGDLVLPISADKVFKSLGESSQGGESVETA